MPRRDGASPLAVHAAAVLCVVAAVAAADPTTPTRLDATACAAVQYPSDPRVGMNRVGPPGSHVLPFDEVGVRGVRTVVSRHLPKAGSSTATRLLSTFWARVLAEAPKTHDAAASSSGAPAVVAVEKVLNDVHPRVVRARSRNDTVEMVVVREPLDRFASGYYFRSRDHGAKPLTRDDSTNGTTSPTTPTNPALTRLETYVSRLPDGESDVHLFPEAWFLCQCAPRCSGGRRDASFQRCAPRDRERDCVHHLRYVLQLERLGRDWHGFVDHVLLQGVDDGLRAAVLRKVPKDSVLVGNPGKKRPTVTTTSPTSSSSSNQPVAANNRSSHNLTFVSLAEWRADPRHGVDAAAFDDLLGVPGAAASPGVAGPLCRYLRADYLALRAYYKPPVPCVAAYAAARPDGLPRRR